MSAQGSYAKGVAKREEILRAALDVFAQEGYRGTSLREIARKTGISLTGVMHYFDSKEHLLTEVLRKRDEVNAAYWDQAELDPVERLVAVMEHNASVPGQIELHATLAAAAADPAHPAHGYMAARFVTVRGRIADGIRELQADGRAPADLDVEATAMMIVAALEGLQLQWLADRSIDLAEQTRRACAAFAQPAAACPAAGPGLVRRPRRS
ncbi:TetR/AcrR family transcriptional regulator [Bailinhaonella thermotolerans]|uniref:TetR/AcrR family transcriptional regulator n=1 Tax=Bailinhaonella thermotolerans TaxID=1070861 RepID=A0A3A4A3C0_9ACTN|nr:TetR/AcrR family transcriptional regulator [Bailinhaonella thermotolerans]RJL23266.1 TetR/AcrR family transcriptional regulator [Bailinhaonella thermotolerans]